jgi:hypothetical protein
MFGNKFQNYFFKNFFSLEMAKKKITFGKRFKIKLFLKIHFFLL